MALPKISEIVTYLDTNFIDNDTGLIDWYHVKNMFALLLELVGFLRGNAQSVTKNVLATITFDAVDSADYVLNGQIRNSNGVPIDNTIKGSDFTTTTFKVLPSATGVLHWEIYKKSSIG